MSRISSSDDDLTDDVNAVLLTDTERQDSPGAEDVSPSSTSVSSHITYRLYVSHFLSTWNSRVFEFGAVLYLATIFPGTLLPMSVYALVRGLSAIVFAPWPECQLVSLDAVLRKEVLSLTLSRSFSTSSSRRFMHGVLCPIPGLFGWLSLEARRACYSISLGLY
jgi:hypothetical protein